MIAAVSTRSEYQQLRDVQGARISQEAKAVMHPGRPRNALA